MANKTTRFWGHRWTIHEHACDTGVTYVSGKIRITVRRHFDSSTPQNRTVEATLTVEDWCIVRGPERTSDERALDALRKRVRDIV